MDIYFDAVAVCERLCISGMVKVSVCEDVIFTGDSLFCGSIGRTDFKGGSMSDLVRTVKEKIMTLPEHTEVYVPVCEALLCESPQYQFPAYPSKIHLHKRSLTGPSCS